MKHLNAIDLRVGNLVSYTGENIKLDGTLLAMYFQNELDALFYPIQLTEDWLVKFGFEKNSYWFKKENMLRFALIENKLICSIGNDEYGFLYNQINFVHQLQNLFYALTKTELQITTP